MPQRIRQLFRKWNEEDAINDEERTELDAWLAQHEVQGIPVLTQEDFEQPDFFREKFDDILNRAEQKRRHQTPVFSLWKAAAAAVVLLAVSVYFFTNRSVTEVQIAQTNALELSAEDVLPGSEGAILTLGDGRTIVLDSAGTGTIARQGNVRVSNDNGRVSYSGANGAPDQIVMQALTTPAGRTYQLQLPDGSMVWLNPASRIEFPSAFTPEERVVTVQGEAFFDIVKAKRSDGSSKPFYVDVQPANRQSVRLEVLGTSFNVWAYADEPNIQTTLVEGSVRIHSGGNTTMLRPAQQAITGRDGVTRVTTSFNMDQVLAWRSGLFYFDRTDVATILRQFSRWYNVDITPSPSVAGRAFSGKLSRKMKLADVLKIMDLSEINYSIHDKKPVIENGQPQGAPTH